MYSEYQITGTTPQYESSEVELAKYDGITLILNNNTVGDGNLFVGTKNIYFVGQNSQCYQFQLVNIIVHAVSKGDNQEKPCLYCQLEDDELFEVKFVPSEDRVLDRMYKTFSDAAEMNPGEIEEDEGDFVFDKKEVQNGVKGTTFDEPENKKKKE